jgi:hypothetical protein
MKPSSLLAVAVATVLISLCTSFSSGKEMSSSKTLSSTHVLKDNTHYYWYLSNGDVYDGWYTISQEISRLQTMYGVYVDLSPAGGATLLARGYFLYGTPHLVWPSASCYGHF